MEPCWAPVALVHQVASELECEFGVPLWQIMDLLEAWPSSGVLELLEEDPRRILGYLRYHGRKALTQHRAETLHRVTRYHYRPSDVKRILSSVSDPEKWEKAYVPQDAKWVKGNDSMEVVLDVLLALPKAPQGAKEALFRTYWQGEVPEGKPEAEALREAILVLTRVINA